MSLYTPGPPFWRRAVLPASITLNLFLASVIAAHFDRFHFRGEHGSGSFAQALAKAEVGLSPSDSARFDAVMRRDAPRYESAAAQLSNARRALRAQIRAEHFDPQATRAALARWQAAWGRFMDTVSDPLVDGIGQVSPEGRRRLAATTHAVRP